MESQPRSYYDNFKFGLVSGICAIVVSHPIDTIKTNIQESKPINYNFKSLYRGLSAPLLGVGLEKSLVFGVFESTRPITKSDVISGALSGLVASFVVTPFERIKILFQTSQTAQTAQMTQTTNTNKGNWKYIRQNLNFKFMFQGLSATFYRETPGFAIYFSVYNYLKDNRMHIAKCIRKLFYFEKNIPNKISLVESFMFGSIAGSIAWIFIYPQDRIKTHIQAITDKNIGFAEGLKEIVAKGGYKGLYRGFHYALMRAIPLHATAFATMEFCKKYF